MALSRALGTMQVHPIISGLWQVGCGPVSHPVEAMEALVDAGFNSFDGADHYGDAEVLMGKLKSKRPGIRTPNFSS